MTGNGSAKEYKRGQILAEAAVVFAARSYPAATTKEVAERLGLSQPTIYHYVGSKMTLLQEIAREVDTRSWDVLNAARATSDEPTEQLRALMHLSLEYSLRNRDAYAVYWEGQRFLDEAEAAELTKSRARYIHTVDKIVAGCQKQGSLPAQHPSRVLTEGILGMLHAAYRWYRPGGRSAPADIARAFCDLIGLPRAAD